MSVLASCLAACDERSPGAPAFTALAREQHDVHFPIVTGAHGGADCNTCHGDTDTFTDFSCIACHEHDREPTDPIHVAVPDYTYERKSCFTCHPRGDGTEAVDHSAFYPIGPGTTHEALRCGHCHVEPTDRKVVSCIDCHDHAEQPMAATHAGMPEYEWATAACLGCHRDGNAPSRDVHDRTFPISAAVAASHAETRCAECHTTPTDQKDVRCAGCHPHVTPAVDGAHASVGGYTFDSPLCLRCHADSQVDRVAAHQPFLIQPGSTHDTRNAACLECHLERRTDKPFGADFASFDCRPCHAQAETDAEHAGEPSYAYDSRSCVMSGCHPDGQASSRESHDRIFPISAAVIAAHAGTACGDCHQNTADRKVVRCAGCHPHETAATAAAHTAVGGYSFDSPLCLRCHADAQVDRVAAHLPFLITASSKHGPRNAGCLECHLERRTDKPFGQSFATFDCRPCHDQRRMDDKHREERGYRYDSATCVMSGCHPDGREHD